MDRFQGMAVFVAVAEEERFAAAGRRLRRAPPAVTRAVAALEERLGVRLLTRTTRLVRTTDAGARYLEDARRILLEAEEADRAAAGVNAKPREHLAVTAPVLFGKLYVMPIVTAYQQTFKETTVSALFVDRVVNLLDEGLDVGIRIGQLPDSSLRAIRVGQVRRVICASAGYLKKHGVPKTPAELAGHEIIAATAISAGSEWTFATGKQKIGVRLSPRILVNTNDGAIEAAKGGFGLTRLISYQVAGELAAGKLKTVLSEYEEAPLPIHVIHREGRHGSASTNIKVYVGGTLQGTYPMAVGGSQNVPFTNLAGGPVVISSDNGPKIIASLYELKRAGTTGLYTGQNEMVGLPQSQLSDTYVLTRYNSTLTDLLPYVVFANADTVPVTVNVTIGGVDKSNFHLLSGQGKVQYFSNTNGGPVVVKSTIPGKKIIASLLQLRRPGSTGGWTGITHGSHVRLPLSPAPNIVH